MVIRRDDFRRPRFLIIGIVIGAVIVVVILLSGHGSSLHGSPGGTSLPSSQFAVPPPGATSMQLLVSRPASLPDGSQITATSASSNACRLTYAPNQGAVEHLHLSVGSSVTVNGVGIYLTGLVTYVCSIAVTEPPGISTTTAATTALLPRPRAR